tara:strand:- start:168 stop:503 length:336 start_codon:yes stop_codon:yes gene_type:complete
LGFELVKLLCIDCDIQSICQSLATLPCFVFFANPRNCVSPAPGASTIRSRTQHYAAIIAIIANQDVTTLMQENMKPLLHPVSRVDMNFFPWMPANFVGRICIEFQAEPLIL